MVPQSASPVVCTPVRQRHSARLRFGGPALISGFVEEGGMAVIEADYFVTGTGGTAMAFVDTPGVA
jgi:hypothetical protein